MKNFRFLLMMILLGNPSIFGTDSTNESLKDSGTEKTELSAPQNSKVLRPVPKKLKKKKAKLNSESPNSNASENDAPPAPPVY